MAAADFENRSFKAYPNPVREVLEISARQNITNVEVYNLVGQQVIAVPVNSNSAKS
jgi:hypothetical protein